MKILEQFDKLPLIVPLRKWATLGVNKKKIHSFILIEKGNKLSLSVPFFVFNVGIVYGKLTRYIFNSFFHFVTFVEMFTFYAF